MRTLVDRSKEASISIYIYIYTDQFIDVARILATLVPVADILIGWLTG